MSRVDLFKGNTHALNLLQQALELLRQAGILQALEERGRPQIYELGRDAQVLATQAARSVGYFEALDDLINFENRFIRAGVASNPVPMTFGADELNRKKGYLTEEEINELQRKRSGK